MHRVLLPFLSLPLEEQWWERDEAHHTMQRHTLFMKKCLHLGGVAEVLTLTDLSLSRTVHLRVAKSLLQPVLFADHRTLRLLGTTTSRETSRLASAD